MNNFFLRLYYSKSILKHINGILILLMYFIHISCTQTDDDITSAEADYHELIYSDNGLRLDLWSPYNLSTQIKESETKRINLIVFIHGGVWSAGDKSLWTHPLAENFTNDNFCCSSIDYQLYPNAYISDQLCDIKKAIIFLRDHFYEQEKIYPHIYLMGHSSGAHLVSLLSTEIDADKYSIEGIICIDGGEYLTEVLEDMDDSPSYTNIRNHFIWACGAVNPINYIPYYNFNSKQLPPPTLLICQKGDKYRFNPNFKLYNLLRDLGTDVTLSPISNCNHNTIYLDLGNPNSQVSKEVKSFILGH